MKKLIALLLSAQIIGLVGCATTPRSRTIYQYNDTPQPVRYQSQPVYTQTQSAPQEDYNKKILKQGLMGAATGAIAAETSGGKAATGALVGAGTNVLGGALFDMLTAPPQSQPQQPQYVPYVNQWNQQNPTPGRIVRKFDSNGNVISEEVFTRN